MNFTHSECYIGCALLKPEVLVEHPVPEEAIDQKWRNLFKAILSRFTQGKPIDVRALSCDYKNANWWPGTAEVSDLEEKAVSPVRAKFHAEELHKSFQLERLRRWHLEAKGIIENIQPDDAVAQLESGLMGIISRESEPSFEPLSSATKRMLELWADRERVLIGDSVLDAYWFLDREGLHLVAARTSVGKTAFALWIAMKLLKAGRRVFFASVEMSSAAILKRLYKIFANGGDFSEAVRLNKDLPLFISSKPGMSVEDLALMTRAASAEKPLDCVIVDYLGLLRTRERFQSRERQVSHMVAEVKELSKRLKCPIILLSQINREPEGGQEPRPKLSNLRESGDIENHADSVILLYRPEYHAHQRWSEAKIDEIGKVEVLIAKQRNHPVAHLGVFYDTETGNWDGWRRIEQQNKNFRGKNYFTPITAEEVEDEE